MYWNYTCWKTCGELTYTFKQSLLIFIFNIKWYWPITKKKKKILDDSNIEDICQINDNFYGVIGVVECELPPQEERWMTSKEDCRLSCEGGNFACPIVGVDVQSHDKDHFEEIWSKL